MPRSKVKGTGRPPTEPRISMTPDERAGMRYLWAVYDRHFEQVQDEMVRAARAHPEFTHMAERLTEEQTEERVKTSREALERAMMHGDWEAYYANVHTTALGYAHSGISFASWYDIVHVFRGSILRRICAAYSGDTEKLLLAIDALDVFVYHGMSVLGTTFIRSKEKLIVEQQRAVREALRASEDQYRRLVELSPAPIAVYDTESFVYVNPAALQLLGATSVDQIVGKPVWTFVDPGSWDLVRQRMRKTQEAREPADVAELRLLRCDAKPVDVESVATPFTHLGQPATQIVFRDITLRKQAEGALRLLASIVASTDDAIVAMTPGGAMTSWNPGAQRTYGYDPEETIGQPFSMLIAAERAEELSEKFNGLRRGEHVGEWQTSSVRKGGEQFFVSLTMAPLKDARGEVTAIAAIGRDVTERNLAQELENKAKLQFLSVLAHELRTPLTPLLASAGMLKEVLSPDPRSPQGKLLSNLAVGAETLKGRINDLLDVAAFQAGVLPIAPQAFNFKAAMEEIAEFLKPAMKKGQPLVLDLQGDFPPVVGDYRRIQQVVSNLVLNAVKFSSEGGAITLRARASPGWVNVEVEDRGHGIARDEQARLFQPYFRVEQDRSRLPGLGLGLALCRQIVEAHGGGISVESELGKGSVFRFSLPVSPGVLKPKGMVILPKT